MSDMLQQAAQAIAQADALIIGTGAGMGVDSGLPDFRGNEGFWRAYPPLAERGLRFEQIARSDWFARDPELAWGFYGHRLNLYRATPPHEGYAILHRWAQSKSGGAFAFTSNVDGAFQKAGFAEENIVECHGSIHHVQCSRPCVSSIESADALVIEVDESTFHARPPLPVCPRCGAALRPNILMFGDSAWLGERTEHQLDRFENWIETLPAGRVALVECGAGTAIATVRRQMAALAIALEAPLIRINPREAQGPPEIFSLSLGAKEALLTIDRLL